MSCLPEIKEDSYNFFEGIDNYRNYEEEIKTTATANITQCCTSFTSGWNKLLDTEMKKNICENFFKLYKKLTKVNVFDVKDWGFLNYWLNFKIGQFNNNNICVKEFYNHMESQCVDIIESLLYKDLIYNIKEEDLKKMNLLYGLHENYRTVNNIISNNQQDKLDLLLETSTKCCSDYIYANYLCNDKENKFCTELKNFKTTYEKLYNQLGEKSPEYSNNFIQLTQCDNNTVSTAVIGTTVGLVPLLVALYKFTPLRQLIISNKGKLTQEYRNNDDEMRNIMLMDQQSEQTSSHQGTYNIKYHSV
ncbi:PIR protein [Plasmodium vivax]|nr:PIR protein [Plasmodium vivax]